MPKNKIVLVALAGICLAGCGAPKLAIYIDADRALAQSASTALPEPNPGSAARLPAKSDEHTSAGIASQQTEDRIRLVTLRIQAMVEQDRKSALSNLKEQLYKSLLKTAERIRAEKNLEIDEQSLKEQETLQLAISGRFEVFAREYGSATVDLAEIVGFPPPNLATLATPEPEQIWETRQIAKAEALVQKRIELRKAYDAETKSLIDAAQAKLAQQRLNVSIELVKLLDEYDLLSQRMAEETIRQTEGTVQLQLANARPPRLPSVEGRSVSIASGDLTIEPLPASKAPVQGIMKKREQLRSEMEIYAATQGFRLVNHPKLGRDETENFIRWRNGLLDGQAPK